MQMPEYAVYFTPEVRWVRWSPLGSHVSFEEWVPDIKDDGLIRLDNTSLRNIQKEFERA